MDCTPNQQLRTYYFLSFHDRNVLWVSPEMIPNSFDELYLIASNWAKYHSRNTKSVSQSVPRPRV